MENIILALAIGGIMIITGCLTAYLFQKHFFSKYRGKVKNAVDKEETD